MANISQNVNIEMLEKLPDGTYKRKYPKTRADDGTTFDEHLADETSHGIGNKITLQTNHKSTIVGAVNELFTNVSNGKDLVGGAITGVDDSVVIPTEPTFGDLASAIGGISTGKKWASGTIKDKWAPGGYYSYTDISLDFVPSVILVHAPRTTNTPSGYSDNSEFVSIIIESNVPPITHKSSDNGYMGYNHIYFNTEYTKNSSSFRIGARYSGGGSFLTYGTVTWLAYE